MVGYGALYFKFRIFTWMNNNWNAAQDEELNGCQLKINLVIGTKFTRVPLRLERESIKNKHCEF